jgi:hypothetical protein
MGRELQAAQEWLELHKRRFLMLMYDTRLNIARVVQGLWGWRPGDRETRANWPIARATLAGKAPLVTRALCWLPLLSSDFHPEI